MCSLQGDVIAQFVNEARPERRLLPSPGTFAIVGRELTRLAAQYRLPTIYGLPLSANGGLMSYSADRDELVRGAATYADRLLRGAKATRPIPN